MSNPELCIVIPTPPESSSLQSWRATVTMGEVFLSGRDSDSDASSTTMTTTQTPRLLRRKTMSTAVCRSPVDYVREFSQFLSEEPLTVFPQSCFDDDDFDATMRLTSSDDKFPDAPRLTRARTLNGAVDTVLLKRGRPASNTDEVAGRRFTRSCSSRGDTVHPAVEAARRTLLCEGSPVDMEAGESWPTTPGTVRSPPSSPSLLSHQKIPRTSWSSLGSPGSSPMARAPAVRTKNEIMAQIFDALEIRSWTEVVAKVVQEEENNVTDVAPWTLRPRPKPCLTNMVRR